MMRVISEFNGEFEDAVVVNGTSNLICPKMFQRLFDGARNGEIRRRSIDTIE